MRGSVRNPVTESDWHSFPGERARDGSGRNTPEVIGTWKQYSGRKISGAFRSLSFAFRQELVEITGKNLEIFWLEYCFHVPVTSGVFLQDPAFFPSLSCRFLRDLVTGIFDLGSKLISVQVRIEHSQ